ncbi:MAG: metal-sulfur cluster assembly factor [Limisphaerales bacterium]
MNHPATLGEADVFDALRQVMDPELDCNLVDLGLIYDVQVSPGFVGVKMTLTSRGCPMSESLITGVQSAISILPGVEQVKVELVWDPPWNPAMLSPEGKAQLGVYDQ